MQEFLFRLLKLLFGNAWNRTGSALALLGGSALTGWVDQLVAHLLGFKLEPTTPWIGFSVMLLGIGMLAWGAVLSNRQPHETRSQAAAQTYQTLREYSIRLEEERSRAAAMVVAALQFKVGVDGYLEQSLPGAIDRLQTKLQEFGKASETFYNFGTQKWGDEAANSLRDQMLRAGYEFSSAQSHVFARMFDYRARKQEHTAATWEAHKTSIAALGFTKIYDEFSDVSRRYLHTIDAETARLAPLVRKALDITTTNIG